MAEFNSNLKKQALISVVEALEVPLFSPTQKNGKFVILLQTRSI